ncbi:SURF1-like protein [Streptomyces daqingensis]|uniref:SURF1-like protein n=1 Tax=Streptomyces daqingensis TaxID=1472640 RepID=A0ABQ2MH88_9ACTN|nr:SURF1 family protein [Streptomyces daqingensis]GGO51738.1 SURF1-like protein [Streptomyces daqingensis]
MYRFLLSRQWVILTLLGVALVPVMIELGFWQLHRHEARVAHNELISSSLRARAVPFAQVSQGKRGPAEDDQFRTATATGRYDTAHEVVVRQRTGADEQSIGYFVLTPLIQRDGKAVLVNRGWIEADGDLTRFPDVPEAPDGEVTVTGRAMRDETSEASGIKDKRGLPPRQVMLIDSRRQAEAMDRPVVGGYLQLTDTTPKPSGHQPEEVAEPDHSSIGPHMAYAVQWWLFAAGVPVGWVVLVRRERRDRLAAQGAEDAGGSEDRAGSGGPASGPDGAGPSDGIGEGSEEGTGAGAAGQRDTVSSAGAGGPPPSAV